jgi:hypothetical protein
MAEPPVGTEMDELQRLLETTLTQVPRLLLEKRLAEKFKATGLRVTRATTRKAAIHILSGSRESFKLDGNNDNLSIQITDEDIEYVVTGTERFHKEHLEGVLRKTANDTADLLYNFLSKRWPDEFNAQRKDIEQFRERLEHRWGKGLAKLRALLTIVREWAQGAYERRRHATGGKARQYEDVMLRLHVRACQVTHEIIVLFIREWPCRRCDGAMENASRNHDSCGDHREVR